MKRLHEQHIASLDGTYNPFISASHNIFNYKSSVTP